MKNQKQVMIDFLMNLLYKADNEEDSKIIDMIIATLEYHYEVLERLDNDWK